MTLDERRLEELMEASQDLHSDAMRATSNALDAVVDAHHSTAATSRRRFINRGLFAAGVIGGGAGAALLARAATPVLAAANAEVQMLQTAAALENLAVAVYKQAATLPQKVSGAANPVIATFVQTTIAQHTDHAAAYNAALTAMGAATQTGIDNAVMQKVVTPALAQVKSPADVIGLALTLEDGAAQTYVKFAGSVDPKGHAFGPFSTIAPVEAQHVAVLRSVKALLDAGAPQLIQLPAPVGQLPAAAGDVGFPDSFYKTENARPATEGALS